ncbi:MAG: IS66 family transposase zinc-finger binding domain-containing protein [Rhodospirillales bacterium]|nr:IS66 family transposase zinc-finger binding domain-containing protein [Rhodospirillales bacterium]
MTPPAADPLPDDIETLKAMLLAQREALASAEARAMAAETNARDQALLIEKLEQQIARLRHDRFGQSSERRALLDQLELQLFELKEDRAQAEVATQAAETQAVQAFTRRKPARRPLPEHLPRERVVYPMPAACPCCGGVLHKLGEDVTETLELVPRRWKVIPAYGLFMLLEAWKLDGLIMARQPSRSPRQLSPDPKERSDYRLSKPV